MSVFYEVNTLCWVFIALVQRKNSPRVNKSYHSSTFSLFLTKWSFILLLSAFCLAHSNYLVFDGTLLELGSRGER